jgi:hypothetical protein
MFGITNDNQFTAGASVDLSGFARAPDKMKAESRSSSDRERSAVDVNRQTKSPGSEEAALAQLFSKYELKLF